MSQSINLFIVSVCILLFGCASPKDLTYIQDNQSDQLMANELVKTVQLHETQYKLQPNDRLQITIVSLTDEKANFIKKPESEVVIDSKGQIEIPVVGYIPVSGLTLVESEQKIKKVLSDYLKTPTVTIKLLNFNFTVIGEVGKQGTFNVTETKINILEAIGQAGGLTENANRQNIRIIRNDNNTAKIYQFNILEDNALSSVNYFLKPNDIILVSPLRSNTKAQQRTATIGLVISTIGVVTSALYIIFNNK